MKYDIEQSGRQSLPTEISLAEILFEINVNHSERWSWVNVDVSHLLGTKSRY